MGMMMEMSSFPHLRKKEENPRATGRIILYCIIVVIVVRTEYRVQKNWSWSFLRVSKSRNIGPIIFIGARSLGPTRSSTVPRT